MPIRGTNKRHSWSKLESGTDVCNKCGCLRISIWRHNYQFFEYVDTETGELSVKYLECYTNQYKLDL